jgi:hypothetical protein
MSVRDFGVIMKTDSVRSVADHTKALINKRGGANYLE